MEFEIIEQKLAYLKTYAEKEYVPIIRDESAKYLYNYVKNNKVAAVLEIGTAIGYSGSIMLGAGITSLTTIEINPISFNVARQTFSSLGFDNVEMILGDAKNEIQKLLRESRAFDMIFLDGAKGQYIYYLPVLKELLNKNGVIFADNVLLHGMVEMEGVIPHRKRTMVVNLRKYLEEVSKYPFETQLVRIEDGIAITKLKG